MLVLLTATSMAACTSHLANERNDSERAAEIEPVARVATAPTSPDVPLAWRWVHRSGEGGWSADIGPTAVEAGAFACAFVHDKEAHTAGQVCCEKPGKRWCAELHEDFVPGVALSSDGQRLFVADYPAISSGARFLAYDLETGTRLWSREALALGPQAHSEYFNVVQLRLVDGDLIAYGDEAHGAYVEVMDPVTGELREHTTLERPKVSFPDSEWPPAGPEPEPELEIAIATGECRISLADGPAKKLRCSPAEGPAWARELEAGTVFSAALVSDGARVVVVTWSAIASGARARAWAMRDGALLWDRPIEGLGPQDHSKYSNWIELKLEGELVIVRGRESHGRYVEALDVSSGALRWTISGPAF